MTNLPGIWRGLDLLGLDGEQADPRVLVIQLMQRDEGGGRVLCFPRFNFRQWTPSSRYELLKDVRECTSCPLLPNKIICNSIVRIVTEYWEDWAESCD